MSSKSQDEGTGSVGIRGGAREVCSPICLRIIATSCESVMKAMIRIGSPHSQADARFPGPFHRTKVNAWSCSLDRPHESGRKRPQRSHDHTPSSAHALHRSQESPNPLEPLSAISSCSHSSRRLSSVLYLPESPASWCISHSTNCSRQPRNTENTTLPFQDSSSAWR